MGLQSIGGRGCFRDNPRETGQEYLGKLTMFFFRMGQTQPPQSLETSI